ncbi:hypothetical protein P5673_027551 [Acropora cervicornis]|uniref:Uncharacterized protein n=1 Tax=Acropora cervicornis TaxID=6130 RepID=A0AAD9PYM6_ACRCE|nr:hypothetical protein P5673_027551 [Acropora cervicornis]
MPNVTVTSLRKEDDSLKGEIATLRRGFEYLQKSLTRNDAQESGNGGEPSCSTRKTKIVREEVINLRKEACKVSATSIGLSVEWSLGDVKIFAQLTPQTQKLLADAKKFQT